MFKVCQLTRKKTNKHPGLILIYENQLVKAALHVYHSSLKLVAMPNNPILNENT